MNITLPERLLAQLGNDIIARNNAVAMLKASTSVKNNNTSSTPTRNDALVSPVAYVIIGEGYHNTEYYHGGSSSNNQKQQKQSITTNDNEDDADDASPTPNHGFKIVDFVPVRLTGAPDEDENHLAEVATFVTACLLGGQKVCGVVAAPPMTRVVAAPSTTTTTTTTSQPTTSSSSDSNKKDGPLSDGTNTTANDDFTNPTTPSDPAAEINASINIRVAILANALLKALENEAATYRDNCCVGGNVSNGGDAYDNGIVVGGGGNAKISDSASAFANEGIADISVITAAADAERRADGNNGFSDKEGDRGGGDTPIPTGDLPMVLLQASFVQDEEDNNGGEEGDATKKPASSSTPAKMPTRVTLGDEGYILVTLDAPSVTPIDVNFTLTSTLPITATATDDNAAKKEKEKEKEEKTIIRFACPPYLWLSLTKMGSSGDGSAAGLGELWRMLSADDYNGEAAQFVMTSGVSDGDDDEDPTDVTKTTANNKVIVLPPRHPFAYPKKPEPETNNDEATKKASLTPQQQRDASIAAAQIFAAANLNTKNNTANVRITHVEPLRIVANAGDNCAGTALYVPMCVVPTAPPANEEESSDPTPSPSVRMADIVATLRRTAFAAKAYGTIINNNIVIKQNGRIIAGGVGGNALFYNALGVLGEYEDDKDEDDAFYKFEASKRDPRAAPTRPKISLKRDDAIEDMTLVQLADTILAPVAGCVAEQQIGKGDGSGAVFPSVCCVATEPASSTNEGSSCVGEGDHNHHHSHNHPSDEGTTTTVVFPPAFSANDFNYYDADPILRSKVPLLVAEQQRVMGAANNKNNNAKTRRCCGPPIDKQPFSPRVFTIISALLVLLTAIGGTLILSNPTY